MLGTSPGDTYGSPHGPTLHEEPPIPFAEPDNSYDHQEPSGLPPPYSTVGLPPFVEDYPPTYAVVEAVPDPRPSYGSPHGGVADKYKTPSYLDSYGSPHGGIKREDIFQISRSVNAAFPHIPREDMGSTRTYFEEAENKAGKLK